MLISELRDEINEIVELKRGEVAEFCEMRLPTSASLAEELELLGSGTMSRRAFCEFVGIGESTLTGWLKEGRVPRVAKEAYVLLHCMTVLQEEIKRLRQQANDIKIIRQGEKFHLVRFSDTGDGAIIGEIVASEISDEKAARVLVGSVKAFRLLQDASDVIETVLDLDVDNSQFNEEIEQLNEQIHREIAAAFDPASFSKLYGKEHDERISNAIGEILADVDLEARKPVDNKDRAKSGKGEPQ